MDKRTRRLIDFLKTKYRDNPKGFRALLPGSPSVSPGPHPTDIHSPASDLSDEELAYHREQLAGVEGVEGGQHIERCQEWVAERQTMVRQT